MKHKSKWIFGVLSLIIGAVIAAIPLFWPLLSLLARECGLPLADAGRGMNCAMAAIGVLTVPSVIKSSCVALIVVGVVSGIMGAIAAYTFFVASKSNKCLILAFFLVYVICSALAAIMFDCNPGEFALVLASFLPLFYYTVAICGFIVHIFARYGFSAAAGVTVFVLWCGWNALRFPLVDVGNWEMMNLPAFCIATVTGLSKAVSAPLWKVFVIGVNGIFYSVAIFVFFRFSLQSKLIAGGISVILVCMAGLIGTQFHMGAAVTLLLVGMALCGGFFIAHNNDNDFDDDDNVGKDDITYINKVMQQDNIALNPDKTTFFHIGKKENWDDESDKAKKENQAENQAENDDKIV